MPLFSADAVIRAPAGDSEIVITTTTRVAGAIHSLTWNGREFIDSTDHGRQLQSALNCDAGNPIAAETFNPTEAGALSDGVGPTSTSRLLHSLIADNELQTTTQMAFWLAPGQSSGGRPAKNPAPLSQHLLTKRVTIGVPGLPQVIDYRVNFALPVNEQHRQVVFESLTGYMPAEFSTFWRYDRDTRRLMPLSDGPGEQRDPVVLATATGTHAMGVIARLNDIPDMQGPTYGRFRFAAEEVVKWNCVYRLIRDQTIPAGDYGFHLRVAVGTRDDVEQMLEQLSDWSELTTPPR